VRTNLGSAAAIVVFVFAAELAVAGECEPLSAPTTARLEQYVHDKFGFAPTAVIKLLGSDVVDSSCYRRVRFQAEGSRVPMQTILYLSPNLRFLSRELMDTTVDVSKQPADERKRLEQELSFGTFPTKGTKKAPITITIFADFQCRYCRQQAGVLNTLLTRQNDMKVVFRHLPLPIHPWAQNAAEMAACVGQQSNNAFWSLHNLLFERQESVDGTNLTQLVADFLMDRLDVNKDQYAECVKAGRGRELVEQDIAFAKAHDVRSTPTIFINGLRNNGVMRSEDIQALTKLVRDRDASK
jgi:protein-disulfide isomerase